MSKITFSENIVPGKCTMSVDVHVNSVEDMDDAYEVIQKVLESSKRKMI